jgi:serine/threonine protein kinase
MAPEVFKHRKYDKKVDIFSFAMILYEVISSLKVEATQHSSSKVVSLNDLRLFCMIVDDGR